MRNFPRVVLAGGDSYHYIEQIAHGFQQLGHEAAVVRCARPTRDITWRKDILYSRLPNRGITYFLDKAWADARNHFLKRLLQQEFDLLVAIRPESFTPQIIHEIRQVKPHAILATWLLDPLASMPDISNVLPLFDHVFAYDATDLAVLHSQNKQVTTLINAYDEKVYHPAAGELSSQAKPYKLSFIGVLHANRKTALEQLCQRLALRPADVRIYTGRRTWFSHYRLWRLHRNEWLYKNNMIRQSEATPEQACALYHQSALCLNIHRLDTGRGYNMRTFEIAGSGEFQLVDHVPGIEDLFEPGREIEIFHSTEEMLDKAGHYLAHPQARQSIAQQAYHRAKAHHTFRHRAMEILLRSGLV